jgi:hypothetical protein
MPNYPERFNIAPTDPVLTVRFIPETKERTLGAPRWLTIVGDTALTASQ